MSRTVTSLARRVDSRIFFLRGHKVILDSDLAELYGIEVRHLNQQVKRNFKRFPGDFVFQLLKKEAMFLRSQFVISKNGSGGRRYLPFAFTEHGAIMAATVLNSARAIEMSIFVVRAFVRLREAMAASQQIAAKLVELEQRIEDHDTDIQELVAAIRELMAPPAANRRKIGFELPKRASKTLNRSISIAR